MEYRKLPKGNERLDTLVWGMGGIQKCPPDEIETVIKKAFKSAYFSVIEHD